MVSEQLVKATQVVTSEWHECVERDYDAATGRVEYTRFIEPDNELIDVYKEQQRSAIEIIESCKAICKQLIADGHVVYADNRIAGLLHDCGDWEQLELKVE